jgi:4-amino-4-deoxy-L-arabinose transferase-like glycosyltransferase
MGGVMSSAVFGWYLAGIFYSYNSEFFWILIFAYFIWSVGTIGKNWLKKVINYFFSKSGILLSIIATVSALLIFMGLGNNHLIPWDEAIYSKVAKNMVMTNEYIIPHWDSLIKGWFEKPPLYMWMMSGFMKIIGFNSWAARLPSAIFGFATVVLVYIMGKKFFNKTTAFISSLTLTTTVQFLYYSRASMLDVTATFFITLALYLYWQAKKSERIYMWVLSGISTGLAVMTKGFVGLLPFLVIGLYEIYLYLFYKQKISRKLVFNYLLTFLSFLMIALPWHLTIHKMFGNEFLDKYFFYHVWDRATTAIEDKGNPFFWYVIVLKVSMRIWFVILLGALPFALFRSFRKDKKYIFLSIWAISIFLFFSIAKSKLVWYITPIYPVLSLLVGNFSERVLDLVMGRIKSLNNIGFKFLSLYLLLSFSLFYLFLNREMVYTSDLNGPQAKLLMLKDDIFGKESMVYLDRMEIPTPLFYSDGPFITLDVDVSKEEKVPVVSNDKPLIFISKKGRYKEYVPGYTKKSKVIKEYDPWVLWYLPPKEGEFVIEKVTL